MFWIKMTGKCIMERNLFI